MQTSNKRLVTLALIISSIITLTGCANIKESSNYETYELKYLVNLSNVAEEESNQKLQDLKKVLKNKLKKFDVDDVSIDTFEEEDSKYISVNFGTIDKINEIKQTLEENYNFSIKKKIEKSENYEEEIKNQASELLEKLQEGAPFETTIQNTVLGNNGNISYFEADWMYNDEIKDVFAEVLPDMNPGEIYSELIEYEEQPFVLSPPTKITSIIKLFDKRTNERIEATPKQVGVSHILIAFKDATRASEDIERSKEEAEIIANEVKAKIEAGDDFAQLAEDYSDDNSNKDSGGELGTPAGNGVYVEEFESAALEMEEEGEISQIVESPFGYHIIKATSITPAEEESSIEEQSKFGVMFFALVPPEWETTELTHEYLKKVDIMYTEDYDPYLILTFDAKGKDLLEKITEENMDNILGIFAGNNLITSFTVKEVNSNGKLRILRPSKTEEADYLKAKLETDPLPVPIMFKSISRDSDKETDIKENDISEEENSVDDGNNDKNGTNEPGEDDELGGDNEDNGDEE